jgi:DNA-directed RNA polymerase specialized sigma24 family protein
VTAMGDPPTISVAAGADPMAELAAAPVTAAFEHLFEVEYDRLVRVAYLVVGSNEVAEEFVQDAFIKVFRR